MGVFSRFKPSAASTNPDNREAYAPDPTAANGNGAKPEEVDESDHPLMTWRVALMGVLVSMGGLIFGYDTGQISGFLQMKDFLRRFAERSGEEYEFSNRREGLIVAMLSIGTLVGALAAAPFANKFGRKYSISGWCVVFCVGMVVQIAATTKWWEIVIGRAVAGLGVGALSILVPLFQSESTPSHIRGTIVCMYQLFITIGILLAYLINFGTEARNNASSWRIPMGIGFIWAVILGVGILFFPETPKYDFRHNRSERAQRTMAKLLGVPMNNRKVMKEIREMKKALDAETAGGHRPWYEIFTGPKMAHRTFLGIVLQAFQQLTGANFFFYYGTTIFVSTGLSNSFVTQIILGAVNVVCTFPGLYFVEKFGRRICLILGGLWMCMCFLVFASLGHFALDRDAPERTPAVGAAMIAFACLFIAAFASTWGPMVWTATSEMFPSRYRAQCMAVSTASNWTWNFLLAYFTPYITAAIDFRYGYVFAGCCAAASVTVYFFLIEAQGRTLEEIDSMYLLGVKPWKSKRYQIDESEPLVTSDRVVNGSGEKAGV